MSIAPRSAGPPGKRRAKSKGKRDIAMTRNLKVLGLALCMAMAFGALAAQGAVAAEEFHSEAETTHLTAEGTSNQIFEAKTGENKAVLCKKISIDQTAGTATIEGTSSPTVTVRPVYEECGIYEGASTSETSLVIKANVNTTGCHYTFHAETTSGNPTGGEHANVDIAACENIEVKVLGVTCIDVPAQTVTDAVRYDNVGAGNTRAIEVTATAHSITSKTTNNSLVCPTETGGTEHE